tara:strand:- start:1625 stop:2329 length:705 start_codon:yes stop_codon:yes gene_type:complete
MKAQHTSQDHECHRLFFEGGPSFRLAAFYAQNIVQKLDIDSVIDIGCADGVVQQNLSAHINYAGYDANAGIYDEADNPDITYHPVEQSSFDFVKEEADAVLLFDVLEHTLGFVPYFETAMEWAKKYVVVSLPNEFNFRIRAGFVRGKDIPCHGLQMVNTDGGHRHLWLVNPESATRVLQKSAAAKGFELAHIFHVGPRPKKMYKRLVYDVIKAVTSPLAWADCWVWVFKKKDAN